MGFRSCSVPGCKQRTDNDDVSLHSIPVKPAWRRKVFLEAIGSLDLPPWRSKDNLKICNIHFVNGKKSEDERSPSYLPSLHLPDRLTLNKDMAVTINEVEAVKTVDVRPIKTAAAAITKVKKKHVKRSDYRKLKKWTYFKKKKKQTIQIPTFVAAGSSALGTVADDGSVKTVGTITNSNPISEKDDKLEAENKSRGTDDKQVAEFDLDTESDVDDSTDQRVEVLCPGSSKLGPTKLRILKVDLKRLTLPFKQIANKETSTKLDKLFQGRNTKDKHCQTDNLLLDAVIMNFTQHLPYALRDHDFFSNMIYPDVDDLKRRAKTDIETVKRYISSLQRQLMTLHAELHTTRHDLEIAVSEVTHLKTCLNKEI